MVSITRRISPFNHSSGNNIQYIVIHDTGNDNDTAAGNANYFNGGDRQASAHYFVDTNSIWQVVEESEAAWHCGDGGNAYGIGNHNSIGIEMCITNGAIADATINNCLDLVRTLMSKYKLGADKVVRHYDASRKNCPSHLSANGWAGWNNFKARLGGAPAAPAPTPSAAPVNNTTLIIQRQLNHLINAGLAEDGVMGPRTLQAIKTFQSRNGLVADGVWGPKTVAKVTELYNAENQKFGVVTASTLNVRDGASTSAPILGQLANGTRVRIGAQVPGWFNIFYGDHGGWVSADYIRLV